jgi:uncharacterized membrane protein YhhN
MGADRLSTILGVLGAICAVTFLAGVGWTAPELRVPIKAVPCTAMAIAVLLAKPGTSGKLIALGLGLSVVGDVLLELPLDLFVPGLVAFLLAHLVYIGALAVRWRGLAPIGAVLFFAWGGGAFFVLQPGLGDVTIPVAVYCAVIATMGWRASAGMRAEPDRTTAVLALVGAILFMFSDTVLAFNKFHTPFTGARYLNMTSYWGGQLLLCLAARRMT